MDLIKIRNKKRGLTIDGSQLFSVKLRKHTLEAFKFLYVNNERVPVQTEYPFQMMIITVSEMILTKKQLKL